MVLPGLVQGAGCSLGVQSISVHCTQLPSERGERLEEALRTPLNRLGLEMVAKAGADFFLESKGTQRGTGLYSFVLTAQQPGEQSDGERPNHSERCDGQMRHHEDAHSNIWNW